ncbi:MAG: chitobiase/beta-hexosaminidase C-terminal domain-containing protein [Muribaculaceae bacterium]|nr:chitobiase/beta-hexosaminidase C-terminal domain-containing protein [Muribaculaceae bacterium]
MKKIITTALGVMLPLLMLAQGWPANYPGVMLQGFYWDSFNDTKWPVLEAQADELAEFFQLVWIPQSANCGGTSMGYDDKYWFTNYNSSFGNKTQLTSMINTFKSKGIGTIADVVINHRKNASNWVDFPAETYKGVTYQLKSTDICKNDDGGETKKWADERGYQLSSNYDTGEDWGGMRDLDHKSENVQTNVKAYLKMLLEDLGYAGFRYDMTKGYAATYTGMYNAYSQPTYSVGEYWDGNMTAVKNWINGTKVDGVIQSASFDFPFRYVVRDAANGNNWSALNSKGKTLNQDAEMCRYSVTFIENHDTQYRDANNQNDPIRLNVEAGNAFMMIMPGTPCVFLKHWMNYKEAIKQMIYVRQLAGIHNMSTGQVITVSSAKNYYIHRTVGTRGAAMAAMGSDSYEIPATYVEVVSGSNYRLALSKTTETAWASKPSGEYAGKQTVKLTAVSQSDNAQLVYTLDGTEPTASNGTKVANGGTVTIDKSCTMKAGLLINGAVSGVITRNYTIGADDGFEPYEITVYLKDPTVAPNNWPRVTFYSWDSDMNTQNGSWPGQVITDYKEVDGMKFYYQTYQITKKNYYMNFVFNQGGTTAGEHQTVDVSNVKQTSVFEIATQTNQYEVNDVTDIYLPLLKAIKGDVNGDGVVNISDINVLINMILTGKTASNGDVNDDGAVNIGDINFVIDIILK